MRALPSTSQPCTSPDSSPLQMSSAEEAAIVARSIPRTSEQSQHSPPRLCLCSSLGEEEKQLLPSHKTRVLSAGKVKRFCRRMNSGESCPHWPDVSYETQKHLPGRCSSSSETMLCRSSFCSSQQLLPVEIPQFPTQRGARAVSLHRREKQNPGHPARSQTTPRSLLSTGFTKTSPAHPGATLSPLPFPRCRLPSIGDESGDTDRFFSQARLAHHANTSSQNT